MSDEQEMTARDELEEIAEFLHSADTDEKEAKAAKEKLRPIFFDLISEVVREEIPLARKTVRVDDPNMDPKDWVAFNEPTMRIVAIQPDKDGWEATLEENESLVKFEFEVGGYKFGRTIRMEGKDFKAEALYEALRSDDEEDLAIFDGIEDEVIDKLGEVVQEREVVIYEVNENLAMKVMTEHPETMAVFQRFMFPGTPKPALMPIKAVKEKS